MSCFVVPPSFYRLLIKGKSNVYFGEKLSFAIKENLNLRNSIFPFLNLELFDLRNIYVVNLKTGRPEKMPLHPQFGISAKILLQQVH